MSSLAQPSSQYIFQVHPSNKSQTAFKITRKSISHLQTNNHRQQQQNPYVYKPKSYSKKRIFAQNTSHSYVSSHPNKKIKINEPLELNKQSSNHLDFKIINDLLDQPSGDFFQQSFLKQNFGINQQSYFKLPLDLEIDVCKQNKQLMHKIEIVSTDNNKFLIPIHQSIFKANSNHNKQEQSLDGVINPFNTELKKKFSEKISFIRDYKSGYIPIQLQNKSKKQDQDDGGYEESKKNGSKSHFIKKKQSTLSLPRTCGVSYIKPSQSIQGHPFQPLPPLIFQCSTSCRYTQEMKQKYGQDINKLIDLCENRWIPVIITNEENMRDLLLGKPNGKVCWVNGILNLWPLFTEGVFIMILIQDQWASNEQQVWKQFRTCHFKFGILAKKSTSGKKLFLKSIQAQDLVQFDNISLQSVGTCSVKQKCQTQNEMKKQSFQLNQVEQRSIPTSIAFNETIHIQQKKHDDSPQEQRKQCKDVFNQFAKQLKDSRTVVTMALKFQMYLQEKQWKSLNNEQKNILNAIIHTYEQILQKKALQVIRDRLEISNPIKREQYFIKCIPKMRMGNSINSFKTFISANQISSFNLSSLKNLIKSLQNRNPILPGRSITRNQFYRDKQGRENITNWQKCLKLPIYYISTRDSFAFDLVQNITLLKRGNRVYKKIVYHFQNSNLPDNFEEYRKLFPDLRVGVTSYHDFYTEDQLRLFEGKTLETQRSAFKSKFLQMTVQPTIIGNRIKRSKFFFGYRYMWTRCQLAEPNSYVGAGVRRDVTPAPKWLQNVQNPLVEQKIVEPNFLNSVAINVYHDGSEGLAQHFDDAVRFKQPIFTLRLVSDGRLSFGSQFYGFCNGAFIIPLPRGCICVLQENSYAANGVKHCVRPCDMSGKSAAIILRQMHHQVVKQAIKYDELIDFPSWLSTISQDSQAVTYAEQKRRESEYILSNDEVKKQKQKARLLAQLL